MNRKDLVNVVAAVIQRNDTYLICQRPAHKRHGGMWEFPGGKVLHGESYEAAVHRELVEELRVESISVRPAIYSAQERDSPFRIIFIPTEISGHPTLIEHSAVVWATAGQLDGLNMAPIDRRFVNECLLGL